METGKVSQIDPIQLLKFVRPKEVVLGSQPPASKDKKVIDVANHDVGKEPCVKGCGDSGSRVIDGANMGAARFFYHAIPTTSAPIPYVNLPHLEDEADAGASTTTTSTDDKENSEEQKLMAGNNEYEVMRAAKALFSKKTRTLYHWMYPNRSKFQLKSAVNRAWDAMAVSEKQFYVSQVLGKFGCVENRLMINPQLGVMSPTMQLTERAANKIQSHIATIQNNRLTATSLIEGPRRRRGRPRGITAKPKYRYTRANFIMPAHLVSEPIAMDVNRFQKPVVTEVVNGGTMNCAAPTTEEFNDDPELCKELEKFDWALHMAE